MMKVAALLLSFAFAATQPAQALGDEDPQRRAEGHQGQVDICRQG